MTELNKGIAKMNKKNYEDEQEKMIAIRKDTA